jgi:release factor glutamine methyltransferase
MQVPASCRRTSAAPSAREALAGARKRLALAGCESPGLDAELLLAEALGLERATLISHPDRELRPEQMRHFEAMVARRADREPVAYILGRKGFRHLELAVDRRVLVPRPETELLVEVALDLPPGASVLDVGTGSGAVALAFKHERPDLRVIACDSSPDAVEVAGANARSLGLAVDIWQADLVPELGSRFDAVLANLPYVTDAEWPTLAPEITRFEPRKALVGGHDGLGPTRRLIGLAAGTPLLAVEVGLGQAAEVAATMAAAGFGATEVRRDLSGIDRVVLGRGK